MRARRPTAFVLPPLAEAVLVVIPPWIAAFLQLRWTLAVIRRQEDEVRPLGGLAYATFVQLADAWGEGRGWVQTVHRGYAEEWRWGGHYTPWFFVASWLASLSDSPWALARVQAASVAAGILSAYLLGRAEAGLWGGIAALVIYACSAPALVLACSDYQDMVHVLPLAPLLVWAARHAGVPLFLVCVLAFGAAREEALVLAPVVALAGGPWRALLAAGAVAAALMVYAGFGPPPYPNPLYDVARWELGQLFGVATTPVGGHGAPPAPPPGSGGPRVEIDVYRSMLGSAWPWLLAAPRAALGALPVMAFHALDPTGTRGIGSPAVHHLAPLTAIGLSAAIVGVGALARASGRFGLAVMLAACVGAGASFASATPALAEHGMRTRGAGRHAVWALLDDVPDDAVLLLPESIAPAAARREKLVTLDSVDDRIAASEVDFAITNDASVRGTLVREERGWRLLADPAVPARRAQPQVGVSRQ